MSEIVSLNVGGVKYTTSKSTLARYPQSMLYCMVFGDFPTATDESKCIFIDRDGHLFRHILNFLRVGQLTLPENFSEYDQLKQEADFYCIAPLVEMLDDDLVDLDSPEESHEFSGHSSPIHSFHFDGTGNLVSLSADRALKIWSVATQNCIASRMLDEDVQRVYFDGRSSMAIYYPQGYVTIWCMKTGHSCGTLKNVGRVLDLVFDGADSVALVGSSAVTVWSISAEKLIRTIIRSKPVASILFGAGGLLCICGAPTLLVYDGRFVPIDKWYVRENTRDFLFIGDRQMAIADGRTKITLLLVGAKTDGRCLFEYKGAEIVRLAFNGGDLLGSVASDDSIRIFGLLSGVCLKLITDAPIRDLVFFEKDSIAGIDNKTPKNITVWNI